MHQFRLIGCNKVPLCWGILVVWGGYLCGCGGQGYHVGKPHLLPDIAVNQKMLSNVKRGSKEKEGKRKNRKFRT